MHFNSKIAGKIILGAAATICCFSCVSENYQVGQTLLPLDQQYDIYTESFDIEEIDLCMTDSLSGWNDKRFTIGAVRDETFGLSTRSSVLTLVPVDDTLDFGTNPVFKQFHFTAINDTTSYFDDSQKNILQHINVYELTEPIDRKNGTFACSEVKYNPKRITKGVPVLTGRDSLSFDFTEDFGKKYMQILLSDLDTMPNYLSKFPGIYLTADEPVGNGGRINMFSLAMDINTTYYYIQGNFAELKFKSTYDGERKDTSFVFYFSPYDFEDVDSLLTNDGTFYQYALNLSTHESKSSVQKAKDVFHVEGGTGVKPVIRAQYLRNKLHETISKHGDPSSAVITKATIELPYIAPEDYKDLKKYPSVLSPTVKIVTDTSLTFGNLTDYSISDENHGDINKSLCKYTPDITHHTQEILGKAADFDKFSNYDIYFLTMAYEITTTTTGGDSDLSSLYQQMAYSSYYNSMYGGYGYSGYGGYDSYSSYYTYMMMAQYAAQGTTSTSEDLILDRDRYYNGVFVGPESTRSEKPKMTVTFAIPKK